MRTIWALALFATTSSTALAAEVELDLQLLRDDCGHYTDTRARLEVLYSDAMLPEDAELRLAYGWEFIRFDPNHDTSTRFVWQDLLGLGVEPRARHLTLEKVGPGRHRASLEQVVQARTSSHPAVTGFDFVVERVGVNGEVERLAPADGAEGSFHRVEWDGSFAGVPCGTWTPAPVALETATGDVP